MADPLRRAATRLEAAVDRLATAVARPLRPMPQDEVAVLGRRLDAALGRLRLALAPEEPGREETGREDGEHGREEEGSDPSAAEQEG